MRIFLCKRLAALDPAMIEHVERRLGFALGRFGGRIERVSVCLEDANGHRGGVDKLCRLVCRLRPRGELILEEHALDLTTAIDLGSDRLAGMVARELERRRTTRRRAPGAFHRGQN